MLSAAATSSLSSTLTFGTGNNFTGATSIYGGTLKAGASTILAAGSATNVVLGFQTLVGGSLGPQSAVSLAGVAGTALDVNGYSLVVGSISGGGGNGGGINLSSSGSLIVGGVTSSTTFRGRKLRRF